VRLPLLCRKDLLRCPLPIRVQRRLNLRVTATFRAHPVDELQRVGELLGRSATARHGLKAGVTPVRRRQLAARGVILDAGAMSVEDSEAALGESEAVLERGNLLGAPA